MTGGNWDCGYGSIRTLVATDRSPEVGGIRNILTKHLEEEESHRWRKCGAVHRFWSSVLGGF